MIRALVIAGLMVAAGPALAEMARAPTPAKPKAPRQVAISGCTVSGFSGCHLLKVGNQNVLLTAKADVVLPPPKTFVVVNGTIGAAPPNICNVSRQFIASNIIATRRTCK